MPAVLVPGSLADETALERFRSLDHPHIARLLDGGTTEAGELTPRGAGMMRRVD